MSKNTPFRYDYVGSFLRPETLKKARRDFEEGKISKEELTKVEDAAILDLVEKQKKAGYHVITDGEFRRATWHLDFMWGFNGVGHEPTKTGLPFHGEAAMIDDTYLTGKISVDQHPFVEHFKFVKALEDESTVAKQTIPAPAQFLEQFIMPMSLPNTNQHYPDVEELAEDIANGYKKVIRDLYDAGCRSIQLDDCSWGMCVDPHAAAIFGTDEAGLQKIMEQLLAINNRAIEGAPEDLVIAADTVVAVDGRVLGKPAAPEDAVRTLAALSGREHTVYTGVTVRRGGEEATEHEATAVRFRSLTLEEIRTYVSTGEPMDKAGSYGIQGYGCLLVEGIRGDYFNVVGLPVCRLGRMLARFGVEPLALAAEKEQTP